MTGLFRRSAANAAVAPLSPPRRARWFPRWTGSRRYQGTYLLVLLLLVVALGTNCAGPDPGSGLPGLPRAAGPSVTVSPPAGTITPGQEFLVAVKVAGVANLGAFEFTLAYNTAVITAVDASTDTFLGSSGRTVGTPPTAPLIDTAGGRVTFGAYSTGAAAGPAGSGTLANVRFKAVAAGTSQLNFSTSALDPAYPLELVDTGGGAIAAVTPVNGSLTVSPAAASTATATPPIVPTLTPQPTSTPGAGSLGNLKFITPVRVVDTRPTAGTIVTTGYDGNGTAITAGPITANQTRRFKIAGLPFGSAQGSNQITFPANVTGVLINVTIVGPGPAGGFVTVFPGDQSVPNASTVNPSTAIAHNFWSVGLPTSGTFAGTLNVFSTNQLDVVLDVVGFYSPTNPVSVGNLTFVPPVRVLDTRPSSGTIVTTGYDGASGVPITAGAFTLNQTRRFLVAGKQFGSGANAITFPNDTSGILAHVTLVGPGAAGGFVTLFPGDAASVPNASTVNPSTAIAFNSWASGIPTGGGSAGGQGQFAVFSTNALDVVVDVMGYFSLSGAASVGSLNFINPVRVVDTRPPSGTIVTTGFDPTGAPIVAGQFNQNDTRRYLINGKTFAGQTFPADVKGFFGNVTIVGPGPAGGFVTAFPGDVATAPNSSTVNPSTGVAASWWANGLPNPPAANAGTEAVFSTNQLDVVIDITGYFR